MLRWSQKDEIIYGGSLDFFGGYAPSTNTTYTKCFIFTFNKESWYIGHMDRLCIKDYYVLLCLQFFSIKFA